MPAIFHHDKKKKKVDRCNTGVMEFMTIHISFRHTINSLLRLPYGYCPEEKKKIIVSVVIWNIFFFKAALRITQGTSHWEAITISAKDKIIGNMEQTLLRLPCRQVS